MNFRMADAFTVSLTETLSEALEYNRREALEAAGEDYHRGEGRDNLKRVELLKNLRRHGCEMIREGRRHSRWRSDRGGRRSAIPRYPQHLTMSRV